MNYYNKYLKYKNKYLKYKNKVTQYGGINTTDLTILLDEKKKKIEELEKIIQQLTKDKEEKESKYKAFCIVFDIDKLEEEIFKLKDIITPLEKKVKLENKNKDKDVNEPSAAQNELSAAENELAILNAKYTNLYSTHITPLEDSISKITNEINEKKQDKEKEMKEADSIIQQKLEKELGTEINHDDEKVKKLSDEDKKVFNNYYIFSNYKYRTPNKFKEFALSLPTLSSDQYDKLNKLIKSSDLKKKYKKATREVDDRWLGKTIIDVFEKIN
jgi:hypothetical protein